MSDTAKLFPITCLPGIKRDGSAFSGNNYTDGQWCRFMRGVPRKIGGFTRITVAGAMNRTTYIVPVVPNFNIYLGFAAGLLQVPIDQTGNPLGGNADRTPNGFLVYPDNLWQFDLMYQTVSNTNSLIAHAAPNLTYIENTVESPVYYGDITASTPLIPTGFSVSGGIVVLNPYLVMFGNYGQIIVSNANNPTTILLTARVTSQKIVKGMPVRGGNSSPAGLLWTLNSLIRMTFTGTLNQPTFAFDTITSQSSILSSSGVVEADSIFYWAGIDRFLLYNGVVREIPNNMNLLWFYQNLNYSQRQKVWATKVPEFGEIWWWFPFGNSTECNQAVIFNYREGTWYDTRMSATDITRARISGYYEQVFADPIWCDELSQIWIHELGVDQVINNVATSIPSSFTTSDVAFAAIGPSGSWTGVNRLIDLERIEPDFWQQVGGIDVNIITNKYSNSPPVTSQTYNMLPNTEKVDMREQGRFMRLKFTCDGVGCFYELGQLLLAIKIGDYRP